MYSPRLSRLSSFRIDVIFAHAPRESLFILRRVCKNWKRRVDGSLVRHIVINAGSKPASREGKIPSRDWYSTNLVDKDSIIDLRCSEIPKWVTKIGTPVTVRQKRHGSYPTFTAWSSTGG
ncbi:hypothetical protein CspHIS471_0700770 [Cutaneotrichosporon sp. HIS471]|nr:hypothetical protein CspHIS471_0700770 [Cutaneotrichosporon sp. HIS471]